MSKYITIWNSIKNFICYEAKKFCFDNITKILYIKF